MVHLDLTRDLAFPSNDTQLNKVAHLPADSSLIKEKCQRRNEIVFVILTGDQLFLFVDIGIGSNQPIDVPGHAKLYQHAKVKQIQSLQILYIFFVLGTYTHS